MCYMCTEFECTREKSFDKIYKDHFRINFFFSGRSVWDERRNKERMKFDTSKNSSLIGKADNNKMYNFVLFHNLQQ